MIKFTRIDVRLLMGRRSTIDALIQQQWLTMSFSDRMPPKAQLLACPNWSSEVDQIALWAAASTNPSCPVAWKPSSMTQPWVARATTPHSSCPKTLETSSRSCQTSSAPSCTSLRSRSFDRTSIRRCPRHSVPKGSAALNAIRWTGLQSSLRRSEPRLVQCNVWLRKRAAGTTTSSPYRLSTRRCTPASVLLSRWSE